MKKFYFLKSASFWRDARLTAVSFVFSSHWTPRLVGETIRGSHAQTNQDTLVLEGAHITHAVWHLPQADGIFCYSSTWVCVVCLLKCLLAFFFLPILAIKTIPRQQPECVIYCLGAKTARWKGKGVLHSWELLYFPAPQESKAKSVPERCKCSREILPHWSADLPT